MEVRSPGIYRRSTGKWVVDLDDPAPPQRRDGIPHGAGTGSQVVVLAGVVMTHVYVVSPLGPPPGTVKVKVNGTASVPSASQRPWW